GHEDLHCSKKKRKRLGVSKVNNERSFDQLTRISSKTQSLILMFYPEMDPTWFEPSVRRIPRRVWLGFQKSMGVLVGGNHTSSRITNSLQENCSPTTQIL
ncbi:hypothetical protein G4B88_008114, partial [Cannabis sativa]